jgi:hypothetical protein
MARKGKGDYDEQWSGIAREIKRKCGWRCVRCGHIHERETGHVLTVHHLDMNRENNAWWNLVPLCQRCHLKIQLKVFLEQGWLLEHTEWFKPYAAGYYAHAMGEDDSRTRVMADLEDLLARGVGGDIKTRRERDGG